MARGPAWTWTFLVLGALIVFVYPMIEPITLDDMRGHLYATGFGAAILGLGLGRSRLGQE